MEDKITFSIHDIEQILPHRYPFLMLDRVIEFVDNEYIVGIKNVTVNEPFFQGHFPGRPVMPGVMILEAMAQTGAILAKKSSDGVQPGYIVLLVGCTDVKFKKQVIPGDSLQIKMTSIRKRRPLWSMRGEATVDGKLVAAATLTAAEAK